MSDDKRRGEHKERLKDFLIATVEKEEYIFEFKGIEEDARKYVDQMRVELSRARSKVKARGKSPKSFRVLFHKAENVEGKEGFLKITLLKLANDSDFSKGMIDEIGEMLQSTHPKLVG